MRSERLQSGENVPPVTPSPPRTLHLQIGGVNERKVESSGFLRRSSSAETGYRGVFFEFDSRRKFSLTGREEFYLRRLIQSSSSGYYCDCSVIYIICALVWQKLTTDLIPLGILLLDCLIGFASYIRHFLAHSWSAIGDAPTISWEFSLRDTFAPAWIDLSRWGELWNRARWSNTISLELCT